MWSLLLMTIPESRLGLPNILMTEPQENQPSLSKVAKHESYTLQGASISICDERSKGSLKPALHPWPKTSPATISAGWGQTSNHGTNMLPVFYLILEQVLCCCLMFWRPTHPLPDSLEDFIFNYMYVVYTYVHMSEGAQSPVKGPRQPGIEVTGSCDLPNMDTRHLEEQYTLSC